MRLNYLFEILQLFSNLCPIWHFRISQPQNMNPELLFPKSKECTEFVQGKNCPFLNFSGQGLDRLWICLSNPRPSIMELDICSTHLGLSLDQVMTNPLQDLFWTGIGRGFDRAWTKIGFCVQSLSNQPLVTCTSFSFGTTS